MLLGLRNAPASFQRVIDINLLSTRLKLVMVYLEEVIVFSKKAGETLDRIQAVLSSWKTPG